VGTLAGTWLRNRIGYDEVIPARYDTPFTDGVNNGASSTFRRRFLLPVLWSCFILVASIVPLKFKHDNALQSRFHQASHVVAFLTTVVVFFAIAKTGKSRLTYLGWTVLLAMGTEWLETLVYHNQFEWADLVLDLAGAAIGLVLIAGSKNLSRIVRPHP
jgi:hypothetical protein